MSRGKGVEERPLPLSLELNLGRVCQQLEPARYAQEHATPSQEEPYARPIPLDWPKDDLSQRIVEHARTHFDGTAQSTERDYLLNGG